jgi:hypothetical protein
MDLQETLRLHAAWLRGEPGGVRANLRGANLFEANLFGANLRGANLFEANLFGANLFGADLRGADLRGADLRGADLRGADLRGADLRGADLFGADLFGADLFGRKPLLSDTDRDHVLYVFPEAKDGPRFVAGCRNFSLSEAIRHWTVDRPQLEYVASIKKWLSENGYGDLLP